MNFNFDNIKPIVDIECLIAENDNKALLEFSDGELMLQVTKHLVTQSFIAIILPVGKDTIMIKFKDTYDTLQVLERICNTLELHHKTVSRKLVPANKSYKDVAPIQSYLIGC